MAAFKFMDTSLDFDQRTKALLEELTLEEKLTMLTTHMPAVPRLGIKEFGIGAEVARGLVCRSESFGEKATTVFPEPFGMAAMFDTNIMRAIGEVTGNEVRICHDEGKCNLAVWGPTVDMERDPRWGRNEESYGEDPFLTGSMSAAFCKGMYGVNDKYARVIPTLKHFYANNHEEDRGRDNAVIPTGLKYDYYLKAFEKPVREGNAYSLMTSYNEINGVEALCNPEVSKVCKDKWGLLFAVTDGGDFMANVQAHRKDKTHVEAITKIYKNHGADIMTDNRDVVHASVSEAVEKGLLNEDDIDAALFGVFKSRFLLGEFDKDCPYNDTDPSLLCCDEYYRIAEKAAEKSIILLKNSQAVLPVSKNEKIAVIGYHANMNFRDWYTGKSDRIGTILDSIIAAVGRDNVMFEAGNDIIAIRNAQTGFYFSVNEDGVLVCDSAMINEECLFELFEWGDGAVSLRSKFNGKFLCDGNVLKCSSDEVYGWFVKELFRLERFNGEWLLRNWQDRFVCTDSRLRLSVINDLKPTKNCPIHVEIFSSGADRVRRAVTECHNAVYFCGNQPLVNARETKDRTHLDMPEQQRRILDAAVSVNPRTVLFLVSGYPYALKDERVSSIMHTTHAGPAMGDAVAKTLFGDISPAGRCPMTWYRSEKELCDIKDYNIVRTSSTYQYYKGDPLYPFGFGLSYTAFRYGAVKPNKLNYQRDEVISVTVDVENVGGCDSEEVVQLYVSYPKLPMPLPIRQLKAFQRVYIPRGETVTVTLDIPVEELSRWDPNIRDFNVFSGEYELQVGSSSADIRRSADIKIIGTEYTGIDLSHTIPAVDCYDYLGVEYLADEKLEEFALIHDWQSVMRFIGCELKPYHAVEVVASNPGGNAKLTIVHEETGVTVAECEIPPTGSITEFRKFSASTQPVTGTGTLRITVSGVLSLKSFRFV